MRLKISSLHSAFYLMAYGLYVFLRTINITLLSDFLPSSLSVIIRWSIFFLIIGAFFTQKNFDLRSIIIMFVCVILSFIIYRNTANPNFFCMSLLIFSLFCIYVPVLEVVKTSIVVNVFVLVLAFGSCLLGIIPDLTYNHMILFGGIHTAHSYGFLYYSNPQFIILYVTIMLLYFNHSTRYIMLFLVINFISYLQFTAALPFLTYIITILIYVLMIKTHFFIKCIIFFKQIFIWLPAIFAVLSYLMSRFYSSSNTIMSQLNSLTHMRLKQGNIALSSYGISLLGQKVVMQGTYSTTYGNYDSSIGNFYIDNEYLYLMITLGLVFTVIILYSYIRLIKHSFNENNEWLFIWSIITIIFALINSSIITIQYNPIILIGLIFQNNNYKGSEENGDSHIFTIK